MKATFKITLSILGVCLISKLALALEPHKETLYIAVASNFSRTLNTLAMAYQKEHGNINIKISSASSATLYAQIMNEAPFDIFFSADRLHISKLVHNHKTVPDSAFTYAIGELVLLSRNPHRYPSWQAALLNVSLGPIAIADPRFAPYGKAAQECLSIIKKQEHFNAKLIRARNINQTFVMVNSGNATLGFVAKSQVLKLSSNPNNTVYKIPQQYYHRIIQQAALVNKKHIKPEAKQFLTFIKSAYARNKIRQAGYTIDSMNVSPLT